MLKLKNTFYILLIAALTLSSCTNEESYKPSLAQYTEDTDLMINVCKKLLNEQNPEALHKVVLAMQSAHTINCTNFNGECEIYHEFESLALSLSKDGSFETGAQSKLYSKLSQLLDVVAEGKKKLSLLKN